MDIENANGQTPVFAAAQEGQIFLLKLFYQLGANLSKQDNKGRGPIHIAAANGQVGIIRALHAVNNALVNAQDSEGATPLYIAACTGQVRVISVLKALGANVNTPNAVGQTPLIAAVLSNDAQVIRALKTESVDTSFLAEPLMVAIERCKVEALAAILEPSTITNEIIESSNAEKEIEEARKEQEELADARSILRALRSARQRLQQQLEAEVGEIKLVQEVEQVSVSIHRARGPEKAMLAQHNLARDAANNNRGAAGSSQESKNLRRPGNKKDQ